VAATATSAVWSRSSKGMQRSSGVVGEYLSFTGNEEGERYDRVEERASVVD
jgi:hypothetical protein